MGQSRGRHGEGRDNRLRRENLNDIVYLTLPSTDQQVTQFGSFGTVESIKAVSELYSPLSGTVVALIRSSSHPELINQSPYDEGWIVELKSSKLEEEKKTLMSPKSTANF